MKFKKEIFQILIAIILVTGLFTSFSWICIHYQNPSESAKETLSIAVSFMGVLGTIFAALIAVLLFNDWKDQHNKQIINNFGLQVYEKFSEFEKKLSIHYQFLQQLDELIVNYDYEINIVTLRVDGNMQYLNNIKNSINEIKIVFNSLYSQFQAYSIASGNLSRKYSIYNDYLFQFNDIYLLDNEIFELNTNLKDWYEMHSEAISLANTLRYLEIEPLIQNLKVE
ncbi:hypothetical protein FW754_07920 [Acinetobacter sp. 1207_04]|uniref:hypothetical protein n=1 Tax=Acinetobacter sp. 1207_04 TaxID=2604449 RepID=UPI004058E8ED